MKTTENVTLRTPKDLKWRLQMEAALQDITLTELCHRYMREGLLRDERKSAMEKVPEEMKAIIAKRDRLLESKRVK